jgi:chromosome segregation ATPase
MSDRDLVQELKATIVELSKDRDTALASVKTKEARTKQVMIKLEHATDDVKHCGHKIDDQNKEIASLRAKLETKERLLQEALTKIKDIYADSTEKVEDEDE